MKQLYINIKQFFLSGFISQETNLYTRARVFIAFDLILVSMLLFLLVVWNSWNHEKHFPFYVQISAYVLTLVLLFVFRKNGKRSILLNGYTAIIVFSNLITSLYYNQLSLGSMSTAMIFLTVVLSIVLIESKWKFFFLTLALLSFVYPVLNQFLDGELSINSLSTPWPDAPLIMSIVPLSMSIYIIQAFSNVSEEVQKLILEQNEKLKDEHIRSERLLSNILPEEVISELKVKGVSEAKSFDNVSVIFTDFVDFTRIAEKLTATVIVAELNDCFKVFDEIIDRYGIEKIKTIGDAYMAAGGLPAPAKDSVKNTALAALEMQEYIDERDKIKDKSQKPTFRMRVGIHTGPVVAGIVGVKKFQYDIWGDTVNTASRMESHGAIGKVNITDDTYQLIKTDATFKFESRGKIEVKGKGEMDMWFVSKR